MQGESVREPGIPARSERPIAQGESVREPGIPARSERPIVPGEKVRERPIEQGKQGGRVVTVPNIISVARLLCAPVFVWLLADGEGIAAAAVLAVLGASDWVDGWIARRFDQGSDVGKVLDPVADRVLLLVAAVALLVDGSVPVVVGVLVLFREAIVSLAVLTLALAGARRIDVRWAGKAGTLSLMFAFPLFLLADNIGQGHDLVLASAWFFAVVGLVLGYYAVITYLPMARAALRDGRVPAPTPERAIP